MILMLGAFALVWLGGNTLVHGGLHGIAFSAAAIVIVIFAQIYQSHEQHQELIAILKAQESGGDPSKED
jgi:uncharacterized YccA/Bax inhibitor family protein